MISMQIHSSIHVRNDHLVAHKSHYMIEHVYTSWVRKFSQKKVALFKRFSVVFQKVC